MRLSSSSWAVGEPQYLFRLTDIVMDLADRSMAGVILKQTLAGMAQLSSDSPANCD